MNNIKSLRKFGTIYLWIFAIKVLQVYGDVDYHTDTEMDRAGAADIMPALLMKPYAYQMVDEDYIDGLLNERNAGAIPLWHTLSKQHLYYNRLPHITKPNNGNSMASKEITFENLNNFDGYKMKKTNWPKIQQQQQQQLQQNNAKANNMNDIKQRRHNGLQQFVVVESSLADGHNGGAGVNKHRTSMTNIRYKQDGILPIPLPIVMEKQLKTKITRAPKKSKTSPSYNNNNKNNIKTMTLMNAKGDAGITVGDDVKENVFPLKDDSSTLNVNDVDVDDGVSDEIEDRVGAADEENGIANSNGNGNESLNYNDNNEANNNCMMAQTSNHDRDRDPHDTNINHQLRQIFNKRAKPTVAHTPYLPAVSGGAMINLGKFFRDLSKNVHVSEQYQWNAEQQKLLEGDPTFGDIKHHLTKQNAATDPETAEWIKSIRYYRPSQKIRSLVEMNPHGQWAHSSQFIDPNYMWVGLGK